MDGRRGSSDKIATGETYTWSTSSFSYHKRRWSGTQSPVTMSPGRQSPMSCASDGAITPPQIPFCVDSPPQEVRHSFHADEPLDTSSRCYKHDCIGLNQFRLLILDHGEQDDPIIMRLRRVTAQQFMDGSLKYYALSYSWGTDDATIPVRLQRDCGSLLCTFRTPSSFPCGCESSSGTIRIRPNLHKALVQLRSRIEDLWLWIDAICIDQTNDTEKSLQIPHMLEIYNRACGVCIWLGEQVTANMPKDTLQNPLDFVHFIVNLKLMDRWIHDENPDETILTSFVAFANLLRQPWFSRRWVVQEVAASRKASLHYGTKKINWIDFADAVQLFLAHLERIRAVYIRSPLSSAAPDAFRHVESTGAVALVKSYDALLHRSPKGSIVNRVMELGDLLALFLHFETTDPRDVVHALLPLAKYGGGSVQSDYHKCAHELYIETIRRIVHTSSSLDIICRHWAPQVICSRHSGVWAALQRASKRKLLRDTKTGVLSQGPNQFTIGFKLYDNRDQGGHSGQDRRVSSTLHTTSSEAFQVSSQDSGDQEAASSRETQTGSVQTQFFCDDVDVEHVVTLPTWVGLAANSSYGPPSRLTGRLNGDSLVGEQGYCRYRASQDHRPICTIQNVGFGTDAILISLGVCLGRIIQISSPVVDGTIPAECFQMSGWDTSDLNDIPDQLWRTLVADRCADGRKAPSWWRRACMHTLSKRDFNGDLNTSKIISSRSLPNIIVDEFVKRVQAMVWNRRFLICECAASKQLMFGFGPRSMREGDLVCVLFGCSVPVVLRRISPRVPTSIADYNLIGECFIHEKMDGEAMASLNEPDGLQQEVVYIG